MLRTRSQGLAISKTNVGPPGEIKNHGCIFTCSISPGIGFDKPLAQQKEIVTSGVDIPTLASPRPEVDNPTIGLPKPGVDTRTLGSPKTGWIPHPWITKPMVDTPTLGSPKPGVDTPTLGSPQPDADRASG